jgi:hypothetical protein
MAGQIFIAGILDGSVNSSQLREKLYLNVPRANARSACVLKEMVKHKTDYGKNGPISRMIREFNDAQEIFDFDLSKEVLKRKLKALVN